MISWFQRSFNKPILDVYFNQASEKPSSVIPFSFAIFSYIYFISCGLSIGRLGQVELSLGGRFSDPEMLDRNYRQFKVMWSLSTIRLFSSSSWHYIIPPSLLVGCRMVSLSIIVNASLENLLLSELSISLLSVSRLFFTGSFCRRVSRIVFMWAFVFTSFLWAFSHSRVLEAFSADFSQSPIHFFLSGIFTVNCWGFSRVNFILMF